MITYPCAKINLGLNIVEKRPDGYHNLETVFYPVPLCDALSIKLMDDGFPSDSPCDIKLTGNALEGRAEDNLVVKAYNLIAKDFAIPRVHIHLYKKIPSQAGLGGGSSDAAFMIRLLDERFRLHMGLAEMERYALMLGADCPFFISSEPAYATGVGERLIPIANERRCNNYLNGYWIVVVKPDINISTKEAFSEIVPKKPEVSCRDIVLLPVEEWKGKLTNDFEDHLFAKYPRLADIKQSLYDNGAVYAQMSGSGSALYGLFKDKPKGIESVFGNEEVHVMQL